MEKSRLSTSANAVEKSYFLHEKPDFIGNFSFAFLKKHWLKPNFYAGFMRLHSGGTLGLPIREIRIGALSSACGRRARFANAQALLAISDFRHAESRTAGA